MNENRRRADRTLLWSRLAVALAVLAFLAAGVNLIVNWQ